VLDHEVHVWRGALDQAVSHSALRRVLALYLDEDPAAIDLRPGEHGKPALADPSAALRFNLSHSGGMALVALAGGREVGVDVEVIRPRRDLLRLAERALGPAAAAALRATPPDQQLDAFHAAWARHEAIVKCHGVGLHRPLPPAPITATPLDVGAGFAAALAVSGEEMPPLKFFALTAEQHGPELRHLAAVPR
jgi:4'-phosphopantetheinyl transferase